MGDSRVRLTDPFGVIYVGAWTIESRQPSEPKREQAAPVSRRPGESMSPPITDA